MFAWLKKLSELLDNFDTIQRAVVLMLGLAAVLLVIAAFLVQRPLLGCDSLVRPLLPEIASSQFEHCDFEAVLNDLAPTTNAQWIVNLLEEPKLQDDWEVGSFEEMLATLREVRPGYFEAFEDDDSVLEETAIAPANEYLAWRNGEQALIIHRLEDAFVGYTLAGQNLIETYDFEFLRYSYQSGNEENQWQPSRDEANRAFDALTDAEKVMTYCMGGQVLRGMEGEGFGQWLLSRPCYVTGEAGFSSNNHVFFVHLRVPEEDPYELSRCPGRTIHDCVLSETINDPNDTVRIAAITVFISYSDVSNHIGFSFLLPTLIQEALNDPDRG